MQVLEGFVGAGNTLENFMTRDVVMTTDNVCVGSLFRMQPTGTHFYAFQAGVNGEIIEENDHATVQEDPMTIDFSNTVFAARMLCVDRFLKYYVPIEIFPSVDRREKYYCCVLVAANNTVQHIYNAVAQKHGWPDKLVDEDEVDFSQDIGFGIDVDISLSAETLVSEFMQRTHESLLDDETNQIILRIFSPYVDLGE
jgi:hypothetical protein